MGRSRSLLLAGLAASACALSGSVDAAGTRLWTPGKPSSLPAVDLSLGLGPARDQGRRNTCSAFAACALGEHLWKEARAQEVELSPQYIYYSAKKFLTNAPGLEIYREIDGLPGFLAVQALSLGLTLESQWPYAPEPDHGWRQGVERFTGVPPPDIHVRRDFEFTPVSMSRYDIKEYLLAEKKPVVFNLMWYFDAADPGTGRLRLPTPGERDLCREHNQGCGGHVVALVGYDRAAREFIFRNSFGPGWGEKGYGRLPEEYLLEDCELCHRIPDRPHFPADMQRLLDNGLEGWSGELK